MSSSNTLTEFIRSSSYVGVQIREAFADVFLCNLEGELKGNLLNLSLLSCCASTLFANIRVYYFII